MREILVDITQDLGCTVLISSHILGELEKIATHYGIIRGGKMIKEISAAEMDGISRAYTSVKVRDIEGAERLLAGRFKTEKDGEYLKVFDVENTDELSAYLLQNGHFISEIKHNKVGLEEYYVDLMSGKEM